MPSARPMRPCSHHSSEKTKSRFRVLHQGSSPYTQLNSCFNPVSPTVLQTFVRTIWQDNKLTMLYAQSSSPELAEIKWAVALVMLKGPQHTRYSTHAAKQGPSMLP